MTPIAALPANVCPPLAAAVLLFARRLCEHYALPHPSASAILTATGTSKSRAYELLIALLDLLPTLLRPSGRPSKKAEEMVCASAEFPAISKAVMRYVIGHPGCVDNSHEQRAWYSSDFRKFIVDLRDENATLSLETFAVLTDIPLGTLKIWFYVPELPAAGSDAASVPQDNAATKQLPMVTTKEIETLLNAWITWEGTFSSFVAHTRNNLQLPYKSWAIREILIACGLRQPKGRPKRSFSDESALRKAFDTFFPGAQWVGDGKKVTVNVDDQQMAFNLELNVDAKSGAFVGISVSDAEDGAAVTDSVADGVATTGAAPLAMLLDNRPSNHTTEVNAAIAEHGSQTIPATLQRPQNKAHVEGAFGLFSQTVPPVTLDLSQEPREIARQILKLVCTTWGRAFNHRPRHDNKGRSRVELYDEAAPTPEQVAEARQALEERLKRQHKARATREARQQPEVLEFLDHHFQQLELIDPERRIRLAIAPYPLADISDGIAIFRAKKSAGTLPQGANGRYLLGIVRNICAKREGEYMAEAILATRLELRDRLYADLLAAKQQLCALTLPVREAISNCVDRAFDTDRSLNRNFWIKTLGEVVLTRSGQVGVERERLYKAAARRIYASFKVSLQQRQEALRCLAECLVPLT
jgi:hypothetical protein